ncbi:MAG: D-aminoacyl-tRNA deacylase [Eubacteriales bacterium]|jgi:D-tyrosyl-tRNA(Tyr) deacylase|nr:D-aminoacyl-tRNA deacylase [Clostridiales bacterium]MDD2441975.1 D-aminoacyl-tRNA deacylase [Eubacteriales bacterium]MDD4139981.1 D-aminoacyl-tRNA deacylase [Eubacteriales bacterium]MDD4745215.1 D-aminoacyl-tRNA deacylase [Eubacteriales bacterium]
MRALVQRVRQAAVTLTGSQEILSEIGPGLLVFLGVTHADSQQDAAWLAAKVARLRVFEDDQGKMNRSVQEIKGSVLVVSQFTLYGDTRRGNRPGFDQAARPEMAEPLYESFVALLRETGLAVATGRFAADMQVAMTNDGPVTLLLESPAR